MSRKPSQQDPIWVWPILGVVASFGVVTLVGGALLSPAGLGPAPAPAPEPPTPPIQSQPVAAPASEIRTPFPPKSATQTPIAKRPNTLLPKKRLPAAPVAEGRSFEAIKRTFDGPTDDPDAGSSNDQTPSGWQIARFLNRTWVLGYSGQDDQRYIREYVIPGETVQNWSELLTHQGTTVPASREKLSRIANPTRQA